MGLSYDIRHYRACTTVIHMLASPSDPALSHVLSPSLRASPSQPYASFTFDTMCNIGAHDCNGKWFCGSGRSPLLYWRELPEASGRAHWQTPQSCRGTWPPSGHRQDAGAVDDKLLHL
eukprot:scaffold130313_cov39-Tisochrysis_lutea.AAC.3